MRNRYIFVTLAAIMLVVVMLVGYGIYINSASNTHVEKLSAAQYSTVVGTSAQYRELTPTLYLSSITLQADSMLDTHFKVDGTITKVYISPGDRVREGQILGEVVNDELPSQLVQAQSKINEATANYIKWDQTLKRYQGIINTGAISRQQMDEAEANRSVAMAEISSNQAYLEQMGTRVAAQKIIAPREGEVLKVYHFAGTTIRAGDSLAMIGDFATLFARTNLHDEILRSLLPLDGNLKLFITQDNVLDKLYNSNYRTSNQASDQEFAVSIVSVEPSLNAPSPYRTVVWKVNNPAILLEPGDYFGVKIARADQKKVLAIPRAALMEEEKTNREACVFVVTADNRLEKRQVLTGIQDDTYVEIRKGLAAEEVVVVSGKIGLVPGKMVQVTPGSP
ncbi:efflux RND transporter periplasmic adaptor subunit [Sporomusa malonica]|uniref:RND family efflux transporter, MFP subunit n=1 Tax=Sporomusa malonica TaxID=112901 RepID=A0A1W2CW75_9FIRM|nr:efflux RND transporter periplasmic adaptor subunit [Sporomusa malonica]SMC89497.1 RND family efflux transporter, MFP subunit [Sporomusa malonica]